MKILDRWLKEYIRVPFPPQVLADRLGMLGVEIESVEKLDAPFAGFVVGEVLTVVKHPDADTLTVCTVNVGKEILNIVCGAKNVAPGLKVAVGLVGSTVPKNQHDPAGAPFVLSRVKIRGVESSGMICSESELGLGKDSEGIMVLHGDAKAGESLSSALGLDDVCYHVEITPNRPDLLSHMGIAREVSVLTGKRPHLPSFRLKEAKESIRKHLSVTVEDPRKCPRFAARMIRGVKIAPSPRWLANRLRNAGLRPRNNVVDITNFVMYECGQPMHAFDYSLLRGRKIIVRSIKETAPFTTLDGKVHTLPGGTLMVCDGDREVSIAGVMGGANSEISEKTVDVVLEAASWDPSTIRKTSRTLGISTDASQRFERGADPAGVLYALDRAAQLIVDLAGGTLLKGTLDVYPRKQRPRIVPLRINRVNALLGTTLKKQDVTKILGSLGIGSVKGGGDPLKFSIPTFRVDLEREVDLIEEVARVYGYDRIGEKLTAEVNFNQPFPRSQFRDNVREFLIAAGFQEAITNSMQKVETGRLGGTVPVTIINPQNQDMAALRTSLLPGLMETVARNNNAGNDNLRLFEIGHVFRVDHGPEKKIVENYLEEERVCVVMSGLNAPLHWSSEPHEYDVFDMKGEVEGLLAKFCLDKSRFISYSTTNGLTDKTLAIEIQGGYAGYLGRVTSEVRKSVGAEKEVFAAELIVKFLQGEPARVFQPLPRYPKVRRDVAFIVDSGVRALDLEETIREAASDLLQSVQVFDVYAGNPLQAGKKSVAFALELMSKEKTLTDAEIESSVGRVVASVVRVHGASLRNMR